MTGGDDLGGAAGPEIGAAARSNLQPQVGTRPLGWRTGAPPRTQLNSIIVNPSTKGPTQIVEPTSESRLVTVTAPFVNFAIYVGDAGVKVGDLSLPPGLPYPITLVGNQELYAVTDAPVPLQLRVQVAPLLNGDRQRVDGTDGPTG